MQVPIVPRLNGTSPTDLLDALRTAAQRIDEAADALRETAPHGRDYLTTDDWARADAEHRARVGALTNGWADIVGITTAIETQLEGRAR